MRWGEDVGRWKSRRSRIPGQKRLILLTHLHMVWRDLCIHVPPSLMLLSSLREV